MLLSTGEQVSIAHEYGIARMGQPAISLTGAQVGIVTEAEHSRAPDSAYPANGFPQG